MSASRGSATAVRTADIREVTTRRDRDVFVRLPWRIYRGDADWVPPLIRDEKRFLDPKHNPFFEHSDVACFLAYVDDEPVGRIAAIENRNHNAFHQDRVGFFGLFECVDDGEVARALLDRAEAWVRDRDLDTLRGPMNFSTNDTCGLLVDGRSGPPFVMMPYNPSYYARLIEGAGFEKAKDLLAYYGEGETYDAARLARFIDRLKRKTPYTLRTIDPKAWTREVEIVRNIYNRAWEKNWGFVPFTPAEFDHMAATMKQVVNPRITAILEIEGEPIGFAVPLPDVNQALKVANGRLFPLGLIKILLAARRINRIRVPILGLVPEYRNKGFDVVLYHHIWQTATDLDLARCEMSWILEDNLPMRHALERTGCHVHRTYRVYDRRVS